MAFFSTFTMLHNHHFCFQNVSSPQKESLHPLSSCSPFSPPTSPWQPPILIPFLWIYLVWIFYVNKIIQYMTFCVWLLSPSKLFLRLLAHNWAAAPVRKSNISPRGFVMAKNPKDLSQNSSAFYETTGMSFVCSLNHFFFKRQVHCLWNSITTDTLEQSNTAHYLSDWQ